MMRERRDFPKFKVETVYLAQDGQCLRCGRSLEHGFARHHRDGVPSNISIENLELVCPDCHRSSLSDEDAAKYDMHKEQERQVLANLNALLEKAFEGALSGANMERMLDAMTLSLKVSRQVNEIDKDKELPPASIRAALRLEALNREREAWLEGFKAGVQLRLARELDKKSVRIPDI